MRLRILIFSSFLALFFAIILGRFFYLQIIEHATWSKIARKQHILHITEPAPRGAFYTSSASLTTPNRYTRIAFDIPSFHLYIDPYLIPEAKRKQILPWLSSWRNNGSKNLQTILESSSRHYKIAQFLSIEEKKRAQNEWYTLSKEQGIPKHAILFAQDTKRSYPFGHLCGQLIHTVQKQKDEKRKKRIPTGGLELFFDKELTGKDGLKTILRTPRQKYNTEESCHPAESGKNIYLTIDATLQKIAEEELEKGVKNARAKRGWAILLDPKTGKIRALAEYPFFNPCDYASYFSSTEASEIARSHALQDAFEIGSIMKPIIMAVMLEGNIQLQREGKPPLFDPEEKMALAHLRFPGRKKPLKDVTFHKYLNMDMAIQKSSNVYPAELVERACKTFSAAWVVGSLEEIFGFGKKTGIEMASETSGMLPYPHKKHANGIPMWTKSTGASLAMGHNMTASSLQMAQAFAVLANGGILIPPTLLERVGDRAFPPKEGKRTLSEETAHKVLRAMKFNTKTYGTGWRADIPGYTQAGKSGTAEKVVGKGYDKKKYVSSFAGIAPAKDPYLVIVVSIDEPMYGFIDGKRNHHGGVCAAPIFSAIGARALEYMGIPKDDPFGYPIPDKRRNPAKMDWGKEVKELKEKYDLWNNKKP